MATSCHQGRESKSQHDQRVPQQHREVEDVKDLSEVVELWLDRRPDRTQAPPVALPVDLLARLRIDERALDPARLLQCQVLDSASPALRRIRNDTRVAEGRITDRLNSMVSGEYRTALQEPIVTMRNGRFVIPVKNQWGAEARVYAARILWDRPNQSWDRN